MTAAPQDFMRVARLMCPRFLWGFRNSRQPDQFPIALNKDVFVLECGDSSNVKSLYSLSQSDGGWQNSYLPAAT
jgi:hypothetical protein